MSSDGLPEWRELTEEDAAAVKVETSVHDQKLLDLVDQHLDHGRSWGLGG